MSQIYFYFKAKLNALTPDGEDGGGTTFADGVSCTCPSRCSETHYQPELSQVAVRSESVIVDVSLFYLSPAWTNG